MAVLAHDSRFVSQPECMSAVEPLAQIDASIPSRSMQQALLPINIS